MIFLYYLKVILRRKIRNAKRGRFKKTIKRNKNKELKTLGKRNRLVKKELNKNSIFNLLNF